MSRVRFERPRKAVFPVAGLGVRFLPATKACPKEMLPIIDRPLIQYAVEEAAAAGIRQMIFVTGRNKRAIEDHFDKAYELERELCATDNEDALRALRSVVPEGVRFSYVRQPVAAGLGDALLRIRTMAGDEPFAVLVPDELIDGERPALAELMDVFDETAASVVAVAPPTPGEPRLGNSVVIDELDGSIRRVVGEAATDAGLAVLGRFIFTPGIWPALVAAQAGKDQATLLDGVSELLARETVYSCAVTGRRYDCGSKLGYLEAQLAYARKRPELWPHLRASLQSMIEPAAPSRRSARYVRRGDRSYAAAD